MVDWNTNEAGTVHRAEAAVRGSRFLREVEIVWIYLPSDSTGPRPVPTVSQFKATIYAKTDMDAPINAGLEPTTTNMEVRYFATLHCAKVWAETWLQP